MKEKKKNKNKPIIEVNNDQLGENGSEEYKSEDYSNAATTSSDRNK